MEGLVHSNDKCKVEQNDLLEMNKPIPIPNIQNNILVFPSSIVGLQNFHGMQQFLNTLLCK